MKRKLNIKGLVPVIIIILFIFLLNIPAVSYNTKYIDYTKDNIQEAIKWVEDNSEDDLEKIMNTAIYVEEKIIYQPTGMACFTETAEQVLIDGVGDCVSKTKVTAAMLTGMDIPIKIIEGCITQEGADTSRDFKIPFDPSLKLPINNFLSRSSSNIGQLHSWLRAYDGNKWYTVETTAGVIFPISSEGSYGYNVFGGDIDPNNGFELCILSDRDYALICKDGTLD